MPVPHICEALLPPHLDSGVAFLFVKCSRMIQQQHSSWRKHAFSSRHWEQYIRSILLDYQTIHILAKTRNRCRPRWKPTFRPPHGSLAHNEASVQTANVSKEKKITFYWAICFLFSPWFFPTRRDFVRPLTSRYVKTLSCHLEISLLFQYLCGLVCLVNETFFERRQLSWSSFNSQPFVPEYSPNCPPNIPVRPTPQKNFRGNVARWLVRFVLHCKEYVSQHPA